MDKLILEAHKRTVLGKKNKSLRHEGSVPAVLYGHNVESESVSVASKDMEKIYSHAGGNKIIDLTVGKDKALNALIHDVQHDGKTGRIIHADFYIVNMKEELKAEIPFHFVGESTAVFQDEGTLFKNLESIEVECLPGDLPESLEVDISVLDDFEKTITVADLQVPKGVRFVLPEDTEAEDMLICKVEAPRSDEEMAELDEELSEKLPEGVAEEDPTVVAEENEGDKDRR
jgi:large subunit ribosomal protein L25